MTLRSLFVDFNSYFASVEQHDDEALRGRPVAVAPVAAETTCCIAASYEAKAFGVKTGTMVREARRLCPDIVVVQARPERYVHWHHELMKAIDRAIPVGVPGSIDEVACELVGRQRQRAVAEDVARQVKIEIDKAAPGGAIRCSIGIAPNPWLAKTASDMRKPDGLTVIESSDLPHALHALELRDLCGIGPSMHRRLLEHGIHSVADLTAAPPHLLRHAWGGIEGERMWGLLHGQWLPPAKTTRSSIGHSHVLNPELRTAHGARAVLAKLLAKAAMRLRRDDLLSGALAVHIRFVGHDERWGADLRIDPTDDTRILLHRMNRMNRMLDGPRDRRDALPGPPRATPLSVSVTLHKLVARTQSSGSLFAPLESMRKLDAVVDRINAKYGLNKVYFGSMQTALEHDAAPMRIPFSHIPEAVEHDAEQHPLWLKSMNQAKVLAEGEHRRRERDRQR
ncbi:DNA polymerase [Oleiagrimonas sp. MCCC 1A03011]|uniref:DNA polymerase Y family protein n=1 Tax=Oleiagrimonas sp. MCCC 1A03011 TaxID=1926883 RepID=UPI000DC38358|nr:DNA polymerase [Oleiagrimonas sp. MCCC 1A03011]RAP59702.1 hypothetical protein BTJ49_03440 [Oleiagrimonas sp. MCCC 1A03011]